MRRFVFGFMVALVLGLVSLTAYAADEYGVHVYGDREYKALADDSQLMVVLGMVSDFGTLPFATEGSVTKDVQKMASKAGAAGMYITSKKQKKGDNGWGLSGFQLHISAEMFKFMEPTPENIRSAIREPRNTSIIEANNAVNLAQKHRYVQLADDLLDAVLHGRKDPVKNIFLDGYVALQGKDAVDGLQQVANADNISEVLVKRAIELLPPEMANEILYRKIVDAKDAPAAGFMVMYSASATNTDIPNLRKLLRLHGADRVRTEAGKVLVRLNDNGFVEEALKTERSADVAKAIRMAMLRQ